MGGKRGEESEPPPVFNMIDMKPIEQRLTAVSCPICGKSAFTVLPRGDESYGETIHTVMCTGCRYTFKLRLPTLPVGQIDPDTANWLSGLPCPACDETGVRLDFRCMPNVRESLLFVTCTSCSHPFVEKAPMEAFE
jgi:hypothetical protein